MISVKRKKAKNIFIILFITPVYVIFTWISLYGLTTDNNSFLILYCLITLTLMGFGWRMTYRASLKIFSSNPEFELHNDYLKVFDNPRYSKIPYSDILKYNIYYANGNILGLILTNESQVRGKINSFQLRRFKIPTTNRNVVLLPLDFADIDPNELLELVTNKAFPNK